MSQDLLDALPRRGRSAVATGPRDSTLADVEQALRFVADVIRVHGVAYLPIFERLERERDRLAADEAALDRAMRLSIGS